MTTGGLTIEFEAASFEFPSDLPVAKARQVAHLRCNYYCVVAAISNGRQIGNPIALAAHFDQLASNVTRDVERFSNGTPLRHEARQFTGGRKKLALGQLLYMYTNGQLHELDTTSGFTWAEELAKGQV